MIIPLPSDHCVPHQGTSLYVVVVVVDVAIVVDVLVSPTLGVAGACACWVRLPYKSSKGGLNIASSGRMRNAGTKRWLTKQECCSKCPRCSGQRHV